MWEYKFLIMSMRDAELIDQSQLTLNGEGARGWEVVALLARRALVPVLGDGECIALMRKPKAARNRRGR